MATDKKYWLGLEDKEGLVEDSSKEFDLEHPVMSGIENALTKEKSTRRDFLKVLGFSVSAAAIAASCEMPVRKSIPYTIKPEEIIPGIPNYYATAYTKGGVYNSILVKTREGRPILFEGNKQSSSKGGVNTKVFGSLLSLYDDNRIKTPLKGKEKTSWKTALSEIKGKLANNSNKIAFLSSTQISPSVKRAIAKFTEKYPTTEFVQFDAISYSGLLDANQEQFGKRLMPTYKIEKADVIVGIGADFIGTWGNTVSNEAAYGSRRKVDKLNRHIQIESIPTLTGSNADLRIPVKASQEELVVLRLYNLIAKKAGAATVSDDTSFKNDKLKSVANELWAAKGKSLVLSGSNDKGTQLIVNAINTLLGNYGKTIDLSIASLTKQGDDTKLNTLLSEMKAGNVGALIIMDSNPAYFLSEKFTNALSKVPLKIDLAERNTETTALVDFVLPNHHFLEAWNDAMPTEGIYATAQPTIAPLYNTKNAIETIMALAGEEVEAYSFVKETCNIEIFPKQNTYGSNNLLWDNTVHDGEAILDAVSTEDITSSFIDLSPYASNVVATSQVGGDLEIKFFESTKYGDGSNSDNPWLLELADPITRISWDHYIVANPTWVKENGVLHNHKNKKYNNITLKVNNKEITLPVVALPGIPMGVFGVSYGRGRSNVAHPDLGRGVSFFPTAKDGKSVYSCAWTNTGTTKQVAIQQQEHRLEHKGLGGVKTRLIVKETTLDDYKVNAAAGNVINEGMGWVDRKEWVEKHMNSLYGPEGKEIPHSQEYGGAHVDALAAGHHWGMSIDLNACTGCGVCVLACNVENNVPVVGQSEVRRAHDMNWLRIDKYHTGDEDNPKIVFQPMLCQHCDNAPCENVCPVAATNHSSEGLNQMTYNRCIGTRYCANNCPYKVRRFNWFDYQGADSWSNNDEFYGANNDFDGDYSYEGDEHKLNLHSSMARMVLNPDVTVRGRGVIEKCSFCVQRIQLGKLEAKKGNRALKDGDIETACQSVCSTNAITFGDTNNENSKVRKDWEDPRAYGVIEEIHTLPSVRYLVKVRNEKKGDYNA